MTANVTIDVATRAGRAARAERRAALQAADGRKATERRARAAAAAAMPMRRAARSGGGGGPAGAARQLPGGRRGAGAAKAQTVYMLDAEKKLQAGRDPHRHQRRPLHAGRLRRR